MVIKILLGDDDIGRSIYSGRKKLSSAPKEAQELIRPREKELFYGARPFGWTLLIFSILMILCFYPEAASACEGRKYGFNIRSQLLKLLVIFPAVSAVAAWICALF